VNSNSPSDDEVLGLMILLHTHRLIFSRYILPESPSVLALEALTEEDAAGIASQASHHLSSTALARLFRARGAFQVMEDVPEDLAGIVERLRARLVTHPDVAGVEPEDF